MNCFENMITTAPTLAFYRGDTVHVPVTFELIPGQPYLMEEGDSLLFAAFHGNQEMFRVEMTGADQSEDGTITLVIPAEATELLRPDIYDYEAELKTAAGEIHTAGNGQLAILADKITPEVRGND